MREEGQAGARDACRRVLEEAADLRPLWQAYRNGSAPLARALQLLPAVRRGGGAVPALRAIRLDLERDGAPVGGGAFERFLIVAGALTAVERVPQLAVDESVKALFYRKFVRYATGAAGEPFDLDRASFVAASNIATLTRFPAGQLDWVVSGLPRSWLWRVRRGDLPRLLRVVAIELGGFAPAFFSHLDATRPNQGMLLERESLRSYHRMGRAMERQPAIKGLITASWFHSPDTFIVSPHLAWTNEVFVQNGGHVFRLGAVDPRCGVLHRSPERQRAYEEGTFTPTEALVIWPRQAMLMWAANRRDLAESPGPRQAWPAGARA